MSGLVEVAQTSKLKQGKVDEAVSTQLRVLSERLDIEGLSRNSLGPARWNGLKASERSEFSSLLQRLLEVVVFPAAKGVGTSPEALKYEAVKGKPNQIKVAGDLEREKSGERVVQPLSVVLVFDPKTRKISDAVVDQELISKTLKRQFDNALKKQKFSAILARMKERIREAESGS